uniref:Reverse transcriptase zinc-binding domain-containing protein n=1 Tax=Lactuca sativa TaxID=4236 RepID=A0A9R1XE78_LACSA|nr:hypothetical protein LSAT_V11C400182710 [Lactuca sativa]
MGSVRALNIALMVKWWWRLRSDPSLLWCRVVSCIHNLQSKPDDHYADNRIAGVWKNIAGAKKEFVRVGIPVSDVISKSVIGGGGGHGVEVSRIDQSIPTNISKMDWLKEVPPKVLCFMWRAKLGRFPSVVALQKMGVWLDSIDCTYCNHDEECGDHILIKCPFSREVWEWILKWCGINHTPFHTIVEVIDFAAGWGNCPKKRRILQVICYGTLWSIWKARNDRLFNNRRTSQAKIADLIKSLVFTWINFRGTYGRTLNWSEWCSVPLLCI